MIAETKLTLLMSVYLQTVHTIKPTNALKLKLYFFTYNFCNPDMFRLFSINLRDLLSIIKAYVNID